MSQSDWRPRTRDIPDAPGVYVFRDTHSRVTYVGKAKSLRSRLPNHFAMGSLSASMVDASASVEWIVTATEVEALQLEVTLIKQHQPRFNSRYRDDKSYPYLTVTTSQEIPRVLVTRGKHRKGDRYFGPYSHAYAIRETLDLLLKVFPMRSCSQGVFNRARASNRPCLLYDIGRCAAPCVGAVSVEEHLALVTAFCSFVEGDFDAVVRELESKMHSASAGLNFEEAARRRDQLSAIKRVIAAQEMVTDRSDDVDVIAWAGDDLGANFQMFFVRKGRVIGRKSFFVDRLEDLSDAQMVGSFIENAYDEDAAIPPEVLVTDLPPSAPVLCDWLALRRGGRVKIRVPQRGSKRRLIETVANNAQEALKQNRLRRSTDISSRSRALQELQQRLGLKESPLRIECFDISNLGPSDIVGSMVVFEDAAPKRSDYRKFKVSLSGQDDFAAIAEVVGRRFERYLEGSDGGNRFAYRPGLVVIDGGKGQLSAAVGALTRLGLSEIPVVSLAKRLEEVFVPWSPDPIILPRDSEALYLMQRIRDEAHRSAIEYQRSRRTSRIRTSVLDEIPGIGPARRAALLRRFGSTARMRDATSAEIAEVPGVGAEVAQRILAKLHE